MQNMLNFHLRHVVYILLYRLFTGHSASYSFDIIDKTKADIAVSTIVPHGHCIIKFMSFSPILKFVFKKFLE